MVSVSKNHELKYFGGEKWGHFHWRLPWSLFDLRLIEGYSVYIMPGPPWISFMRLFQSVMHGMVSCLHVSLLVVIAGRRDCTKRGNKAGEGESKAWMDNAATGNGKGDRRTWRGTWRRAVATSLHTRGAQSHPLWVLFSTRKILAFLGKSIFISCWWDCKMWQPSLHIWVPLKTDDLKHVISRTWNPLHNCEINQ